MKNPIKWIKKIASGFSTDCIYLSGTEPDRFSTTQKLFIQWNAEHLGITIEESKRRYLDSWKALNRGHGGQNYRKFNDISYRIHQVFFNDSEKEIYEAYRHHSYMHFLRMLSYPDPKLTNSRAIEHFSKYKKVTILDYGCGLAQKSRALAQTFLERNTNVQLYLVDISTIRKEFLIWVGEKTGIDTFFIESGEAIPIPDLPECDICVAIDFFEHVYDPVKYFEAIHAVLKNGGLFWADIADHKKEFMHVSPRLASLREKLSQYQYTAIEQDILYEKII